MTETVITRCANHKDLKSVAKIHKESYPKDHFLNELSLYLIKNYYESFLKYPCIFLVSVRSEKICGFVLGGRRDILVRAKNDFIRENKYKIGLYVISNLFSVKFMRKFLPRFVNLLKTGLFKRFHKINSPEPQMSSYTLLSIAVANEMKGKNTGKILLYNFENELAKLGVEKYTLSVKKSNIPAIKFYYKNGFRIKKKNLTAIYLYKKIL